MPPMAREPSAGEREGGPRSGSPLARTSHDQNFKNLILDYPRRALEFFAPEEAPAPGDDVDIVPVRQEQLQERLGGRYRELDTPLRVNWADGRRAAVVFALEEETDGRRFSRHRLAHYCLDLAELFDTERVVPVSIFLRAAPEPARETLALGTERERYLTFKHLSCRLAAMDAAAWLVSNNPVALANLPNMHRPANLDRIDVYAWAMRGLRALEPDGAKLAKYAEFIDIYAALADNEFESYRRRYPEESRAMAGMIQKARDEGMRVGRDEGMRVGRDEGMRVGRDEGMRVGRDEGIRQGRVAGERVMLERLLRRRFGRLDTAVAERLHGASATDLEAWAENVLDARTLDDVFDRNA